MKTFSFFGVAMATVFSIIFSLSSNPLIAQDYNIVVPDDYLTIQGAINAANTGDVIGVRYRYMDPYKENIEIDFDVDLTIIGFGEMPPIIDGSSNGHVIYLDGSSSQISLKLVNLRIINGNANDNNTAVGNLGGGIYAGNSYVEIDNCLFNKNSAQHGGGIYFDSSGAAINNCKFERNTTIDGGGAIAINGNLVPGNDCTITRTVFRKNNADGVGGAISLTDAKLILYHCDFLENSNSGNFGPGASALHDWNSGVTAINCIFLSNVGGAAYWYDFPSVNPAPNHHDPILESNNFWDNSVNFEGPLNNPVFVDGDPNLDLNFVPIPVSSCIDTGQPIPGINDDYYGTAPDIGAMEYSEPYTPPSDRTILCYLYECLNGDGWNDNTKWCSDAPLEDWFGITVEGNRVVEINVDSNGLTGELSSQLGNLDQLRVLNLFNNRIGGSFPTEIWNLTQLEKIDIYYNGLVGSIPTNIGEFTNLIHFDIGNNQFGGPIPDDLFKLTQLEHLALNANYGFTSDWPYKFVKLINLKFVNIGDANFGDDYNNRPFPEDLSDLKKIECLNLSNNNFTGDFPDEVVGLTNLVDLQLFNNRLTGTIPADIWRLSQLKYFSVWNNELESPLPSGLQQLSTLEQLHLYDNNFTSEDCDLIQTLSSKPVLNDFVHSPQTGGFNFSTDCGLYPDLVQGVLRQDYEALIDLFESTYDPEDPWTNSYGWDTEIPVYDWHGITVEEMRVVKIKLRSNNLTGEIPNSIDLLSELKNLDLALNHITGNLPSEIGNLNKLEDLIIHDNDFSGPLPENIYNATNLIKIYLGGNNFDGSISTAISNLVNLNTFDNWGNNFSPNWPSTIFQMPSLEYLLIGNEISSESFPPSWNLPNLKYLSFSGCELSGQIPYQIGSCTNLETLILSYNNLTGPIPNFLVELEYLSRLDLYLNYFSVEDCTAFNELRVKDGLDEFYHSEQNNGFVFYSCWDNCSDQVKENLNIGENVSTGLESWYTYTPTEYELITITSCDPSTFVEPGQYDFDTYLVIYDGCNEIIKTNDDMESDCQYNRASSSITFVVEPGHTYNIYWPQAYPTPTMNFPFVFNVYSEPVPEIETMFDVTLSVVQVGEPVAFHDNSLGFPNTWNWSFPGADITQSVIQNPTDIKYNMPGIYRVELEVSNSVYTGNLIKQDYVMVLDGEYQGEDIFREEFDCANTGLPEGWSQYDYSNTGKNWIWADAEIPSFRTVPLLPSSSSSNGYMVFPAGMYNTVGDQWSTNPFKSYLQSPSIDCRGYESIVITMEDLFAWWNGTPDATISVQISNNDGGTWTPFDMKRGLIAGELSGKPSKPFINITNLALNQESVTLRFLWDNLPWFYWLIDDVQVLGVPMTIPVSIEVDPVVFIGYDQAGCTEITPEIEGGTEPFTYEWSTGETTESINVCPEDFSGMKSTMEYWVVVTDNRGSKGKAVFNVEFVDVSCGKKGDKVLLCVNDKNPHTICVSPNSVPAHLANGATLGPCSEKSGYFGDESDILTFSCNVYPNPSNGVFNLEITMLEVGNAKVAVKDMLGRIMVSKTHNLGQGVNYIEMDLSYLSQGMYVIELIAGHEKVTQALVVQ